jgi:hypothetical protein
MENKDFKEMQKGEKLRQKGEPDKTSREKNIVGGDHSRLQILKIPRGRGEISANLILGEK